MIKPLFPARRLTAALSLTAAFVAAPVLAQTAGTADGAAGGQQPSATAGQTGQTTPGQTGATGGTTMGTTGQAATGIGTGTQPGMGAQPGTAAGTGTQMGMGQAGMAAGEIDPERLDSSSIRQLQQALNQEGFHSGEVDGIWGPQTESALRNYQQKQGMEASGKPDQQTMQRLGVTITAPAAGIGTPGTAGTAGTGMPRTTTPAMGTTGMPPATGAPSATGGATGGTTAPATQR